MSGLDDEIRKAERRLEEVRRRAGERPAVLRPTQDFVLPPEPLDGEELMFVLKLATAEPNLRIIASGGMRLRIIGAVGGRKSEENGFMRPSTAEDAESGIATVRLKALVTEKLWINTHLTGTWHIDC